MRVRAAVAGPRRLVPREGQVNEGKRRAAFWLAAAAIAATGSVVSVRAATPLTLDEPALEGVIFLALPWGLLTLAGRLSRILGLSAAAAAPFGWLWLSKSEDDSFALWLLPALTAAILLAAAALEERRRLGRKPLAAALLAFCLAVLVPTPQRPAAGVRLVLIGWDGATWQLVDKFAAEGKLPNIERLIRNGHRARLRSLPSLLSPRVWTTVATGCPTEVHGITGWTSRKSDLRVGRIWDQLKKEGRSFGLCDWYFTWPPEPGDEERDFIIPSHLAPTSVTFPERFYFYRVLEDFHKLKEQGGQTLPYRMLAGAAVDAWRNGVRLSTVRRGVWEAFMQKLGRRTKLDRGWRDRLIYAAIESDVLAELLRTRGPEFVAAIFTQIDSACHKYWKYMDPSGFAEVTEEDVRRYGNAIREIYAECDRGLGKVLEFVPEGADVMIVSDHGFASLGEKIAGRSCRIRVLKLIQAMGYEGRLFGTNVGNEVYLWPIAGTRRQKEEIARQVEPILREAKVKGEDHPLFTVSREGESVHIRLAPRTTVPEDSMVAIAGREVKFKRIVRAALVATQSGDHQPDGIYVLSGPSAGRSVEADSLNVLEVAPTVAAILGLPRSPLWPGKPALVGVKMREARPGDYPPPGASGEEPERVNQELIRKLRALGYLE